MIKYLSQKKKKKKLIIKYYHLMTLVGSLTLSPPIST